MGENKEKRRARYLGDRVGSIARSSAYNKANAPKVLAAQRARRAANPERTRAQYRTAHLARYGLTPETYVALLLAQGGVCAICKQKNKSGRRLHVDHVHGDGRVRALLCNACNCILGHAEDQPERLDAAAAFLRGQMIADVCGALK